MLTIYDTLKHAETNLDLDKSKPINFYSCGPTVYGFAHIGNLRSFIMADVLYRTLKADGYEVKWVMNITDLDDKTIKGTINDFGNNATVSDLKTYTQRFTEQFLEDLRAIGINTEHIEFINVTDVITEVRNLILTLLEKGYAYKAEDNSIYFNIDKYQADFKDYGALVGSKFLEGKKISARVKNDEYDKDNLSDFALWKAWDESDAQIFWEHPILGKGRPGWHIECSAINQLAFKGAPTDIHTGGIDLIFPHHTNEIAQSQPIGPFVKHWVHFEHLLVDGKKMAKSLKNFYTLKDLEVKGFSGLDLRYLFLQSSFQQQTNFTWAALESAAAGRKKLQNSFADNQSSDKNLSHDSEFLNALNSNLNTAEALALAHQDKSQLSLYDQVLGLDLTSKVQITITPELQTLLDQRAKARQDKDFTLSDQLRDEISTLGYEVKDTSEGQQISLK